ncbi:tRNA lysidine(34) synthetase TilS [Nitrosospira multiformis]|uniref:tRNA lysidine(34) synthetase TilS n=1 Tax=Nitrosospira multiformis TaxID=1231 RepID=UPI0008944917|nr:tRNA lysidine(34) synthetase TilS [Nitrosospira multiformis]SDZ99367.1 tRNA(Ile)-lysidine synthase [Nitrosospira multiformis]
MASSRKSKSDNISRRAQHVLRTQVPAGDHLTIALSGGVDSVVLLDLLVPLASQMQLPLSAVHVNHGISPNADKWSEFCRNLCQFRNIPLEIARVKVAQGPGISLEAAAREERYRIFRGLQTDYIVLAQHLDDQAETLLLQLLRGAGVKGLSAMPVVRTVRKEMGETVPVNSVPALEGRPRLLRPLLDVSRREIVDYARKHALRWITDESNDEISFDRNFLRHELFPLMEKRFPAYRTTFLRASRHMAEASALLDELAEVDSARCAVPGKLHVEDLRKLGFPRARNLLRYTLAQHAVVLPSTVKLEEILRQLVSSYSDTKLHVVFGNTEIRCFRGRVHIRKAQTIVEAIPEARWHLPWRGEEQLFISELGVTLRFTRSMGAGIGWQKINGQPVTIRLRQGGERLRPDCKRPRRSLKNLLREASLPPWQRQRLPLIFSGEQLVCVPGIGVDCDFQAADDEQGLVVEWRQDLFSP